MTSGLSGQRAIVTGAASGIGAAVARMIEAGGGEVVRLDKAASVDVVVDIADRVAVDAAFGEIVAAAPVQIIVHCAAIPSFTDFARTTGEEWAAVMSVNAGGTFNILQAGLPALASHGYGRVVTVASIAAFFGYRSPSYAASKAAVVALTKSAAVAYAASGVTVNCVCPGRVDTPMAPLNSAAEIAERVPVGRAASADEIAALICALASPEMAYVTGAAVPCDGGMSSVFALHGLGPYGPPLLPTT